MLTILMTPQYIHFKSIFKGQLQAPLYFKIFSYDSDLCVLVLMYKYKGKQVVEEGCIYPKHIT